MADIYNVVRGDGVFFEGMTKEQIYELIAEMTGETVQDIDQAFITKLKEINKGNSIRLWVGTTAEYNALTEKEEDVLYICTDDTFVYDTGIEIQNIKDKIDSSATTLEEWMENFEEQFTELQNGVMNNRGVWTYTGGSGTRYVDNMNIGDVVYVQTEGNFGGSDDLCLPNDSGKYYVDGAYQDVNSDDGSAVWTTVDVKGLFDGGSVILKGGAVGSPSYGYNKDGKYLIIRIA